MRVGTRTSWGVAVATGISLAALAAAAAGANPASSTNKGLGKAAGARTFFAAAERRSERAIRAASMPSAATAVRTARLVGRLCVGGPGCFSTIQAAVDAAHDGDTVRIHAGTFAGGVQIAKSLSVIGAGAGDTIIRGGGPVLTIGTWGSVTQPAAVSVTGVTITGGDNRTSPSPEFVLGGGVLVAPAVDVNGKDAPGASVTIADSVIAANRVQPSSSSDWGISCPDGFDCPGAFAGGAGIESHGNLTLVDTTVRDNRAVTDTGYAGGGGIRQLEGSLTLRRTVVADNESLVTPPHGIWPWGAGVILDGGSGAVVIADSVIRDNRVSMESVYPVGAGTNSTGAALDFDERRTGPVTVTNTQITGNMASGFDPAGDGSASSIVYVNAGSPLTMRNTVIGGNRTIASGAHGLFGGAIVVVNSRSVITHTAIKNNSGSVTSTDEATGLGALVVGSAEPVLLADSVVDGNDLRVTASGDVFEGGGGVFNFGALELRNTRVTHNSARATGASGSILGGGIWNGGVDPQLTLVDSVVARNAIGGSAGLTAQGGGMFTAFPVTLVNSPIVGNTPDQCAGC